jgi:hypothetical protein
VLDAMVYSPAIVKNVVWDIVAWNSSALAVLTDYRALAPERRNLLRRLFTDPDTREMLPDWESNARLVVAVFRADIARSGASKRAEKLIAELIDVSPQFAAMWQDHDVEANGEGTKLLRNPLVGRIALNYSSFAVDGQPSLSMMIFTPSEPIDQERIRSLMSSQTEGTGVLG